MGAKEAALEGRERFEDIKRQRTLQSVAGALSSVVVCQVLFASFAVGHQRGPTPMTPLELIAGVTLALVLGIAFALPTIRRRLETDAEFRLGAVEGRHKRRVVLFEDHLVIDQDVVLLPAIDKAELKGTGLVLRYRDPTLEGPVLRELEGEESKLKRLQSELRRACPELKTASPA